MFEPEPPQLESEPVSASSDTPQDADAVLAADAFIDPGDVSTVVTADDDDVESCPAGTGDPLAQVVAPEALELQPFAPMVAVSCTVADCASPLAPPASATTQFVALAVAVAPTTQASEATAIVAIVRAIVLAIRRIPPGLVKFAPRPISWTSCRWWGWWWRFPRQGLPSRR